MIYCIIRIHSSVEVGGGSTGRVAVTPILNLCNQLEPHFYSRTVAVIQSVTSKPSDNKYSPQPAAAESRWNPPIPSYPRSTACHSRTDGTR